MSETRDFLAEIGTEELPPRALLQLSMAFAAGLASRLDAAGLNYADIQRFATPRRLAVRVKGLVAKQPDRAIERRGPPVNIAFDEAGTPTKAATEFARSHGVELDTLDRLVTDKGAWLVYRAIEPGQATAALLPAMTRDALDELPTPKRMRWGSGKVEFVRPVHWILLRFGDEVLDREPILGLTPGPTTRGHRFHALAPLLVTAPSVYEEVLASHGFVIADFDERRQRVRAAAETAARQAGGHACIDEALLDEVTALVEWPVAVAGRFEERYLKLPPEVLIASMQAHQRCFPVVDENGALLPWFVATSNIESRDPAEVRAGNERVIRPRLADAAFFYEQDRKYRLVDRVGELKRIVFQGKLGTVHDKTTRIAALSSRIASQLGIEQSLAERAALLCKCDLVTLMVGEFPELQGTIGRYYAEHDGEPEPVGRAIGEHYRPRFAGDRLPDSRIGQTLAISDKLDLIVGIFAIGQKPSGTKDPYGLRRNALGVLRIMVEAELDLDLRALLAEAIREQPVRVDPERLAGEVYDFMMDRLRAYYLDGVPGFSITPELFEAVLARHPARPLDFDRRLRAVAQFMQLEAADSLAAANKRIANILRRVAEPIPEVAERAALKEPAERTLQRELARAQRETESVLARGDYTAALSRLANLRGPVDDFFDTVMVMCDDPALRRNRLALLNQLRALFLSTADLSRLSSG